MKWRDEERVIKVETSEREKSVQIYRDDEVAVSYWGNHWEYIHAHQLLSLSPYDHVSFTQSWPECLQTVLGLGQSQSIN